MEPNTMLDFAKSIDDASRSSANYGKLMLIRDLIMEINDMDIGISSKACIKVFLENKKAKIKEEIKRDSKFPDPYLDKM